MWQNNNETIDQYQDLINLYNSKQITLEEYKKQFNKRHKELNPGKKMKDIEIDDPNETF